MKTTADIRSDYEKTYTNELRRVRSLSQRETKFVRKLGYTKLSISMRVYIWHLIQCIDNQLIKPQKQHELNIDITSLRDPLQTQNDHIHHLQRNNQYKSDRSIKRCHSATEHETIFVKINKTNHDHW